jgi:hypothetical protein
VASRPKTAEEFQRKLLRDLAALKSETQDHPTDPRWWYYLGQTQEGLRQFAEAITAYTTCAALPGWDEQSAWACYCAARCYAELSDMPECVRTCALGLAKHAQFSGPARGRSSFGGRNVATKGGKHRATQGIRAAGFTGDGSNIRDWLYVGDHCAAIRDVLAGGRVGETYNVGGDAERRNLEVVHALCDALDARRPRADGQSRRVQITFVKDRPGHDKRYAIDASKLKRELGWAPTVSFEQGLARTIDWYLDNEAWVGKILDGSYRLERIGTQA